MTNSKQDGTGAAGYLTSRGLVKEFAVEGIDGFSHLQQLPTDSGLVGGSYFLLNLTFGLLPVHLLCHSRIQISMATPKAPFGVNSRAKFHSRVCIWILSLWKTVEAMAAILLLLLVKFDYLTSPWGVTFIYSCRECCC